MFEATGAVHAIQLARGTATILHNMPKVTPDFVFAPHMPVEGLQGRKGGFAIEALKTIVFFLLRFFLLGVWVPLGCCKSSHGCGHKLLPGQGMIHP